MPHQGRKNLLTDALGILFGALLILCLVPTMQWIDRGSVANNLEMDVPNPGGLGLLMGFLAANGLCFVVTRKRLLPKRTALVLYVMLTISLPFCSVGLVTPMVASIQSAARELYHRAEPGGMLHIHEWQKPGYFPKMDDETFQYYLNLREPEFAEEKGIIDPKAESLKTARHLRQFWDGMYVTPETKDEFMDPELGVFGRAAASWQDIPWRVWGRVFARWGAFAVLLMLGTMFLAQILYRDWAERENLPFPVAQVPLLLIDGNPSGEGEPSPFRNPFLLGGVAFAFLVLLLSGLAHYQFINIPLDGAVTFQRINFNEIFVREPFSFIKNNYLFLSPLMVGIAFMVHQDILRGCLWVFFALQLARMLAGIFEPSISEGLGASWHGNKWPYYPEIGTGAAIVFALALLWRSRAAFLPDRRKDGRDDQHSGTDSTATGSSAESSVSYLPRRWAGPGLLAAVVGIALFWYRMGTEGLGAVFVVGMVVLWTFVAAVALARCRTEGGLAASGTTLVNDRVTIPGIGSASMIGAANTKALAHGEWLTISTIPGVLASQIEGLYLASRLKVSPRVIAVAVFVAFLVALVVGILSCLVLGYWTGGLNNSQRFFSGMALCMWHMGGDLVYQRFEVDWLWCAMVISGAVAMAALLLLRKKYPRFPLPPICLLIICLGTVMFQTGQDNLHPCYSPGPYVCFVWGPMLVAFIIKKLVLRFGGMDLYVRVTPAALGLILGQALMIVFWNVFHLIAAPENVRIFAGVFN